MKAKQLIVAVAAAVALPLPAFADQLYPYVYFSGFQSTKSRAEVMQELKDAQANGNYVVGGNEYVSPAAGFVSSKSRAHVIAELQQSEADGSYALAHQEYVEPAAGFVSTKSRAQVIAELKQSKEDGSYDLAHEEYPGQFPTYGRGNAGSRVAHSFLSNTTEAQP